VVIWAFEIKYLDGVDLLSMLSFYEFEENSNTSDKVKVKISLLKTTEAHRVVRG
jgi:hypothetical protein